MIIEKKGNLLNETDAIIAHQVNCKGVMGAGVAKQIRQKLLSEECFQTYKKLCKEKKTDELLGHIQICKNTDGIIVANLFGENIPTGKGLDTDYNALYQAFVNLQAYVLKDIDMDLKDAMEMCKIRQKVALALNTAPEEFDDIPDALNEVYADMQNLKESIDRMVSDYPLKDIAIPKNIGCALAGGDWNIVYNKILVPLFDEHPITLRVVELEEK